MKQTVKTMRKVTRMWYENKNRERLSGEGKALLGRSAV